MFIVFCLGFLLCFSQIGAASFSAQVDLVNPSLSCSIKGDKDSWFRDFSVDANEENQKWQTTFRIKENTDSGTNSLNLVTSAWQKDKEQGADLSFVWQSGHATLQGKYTLSEGGTRWSPKIITDFNPYFDAKLQYEYLTNGGKWQFSYSKKLSDVVLSSTFAYYLKPTCTLALSYAPGPADIVVSLSLGKGGITKTSAKIGFNQDIFQGYFKVDVDRYTKSTVTMQLGVAKLKLNAKVQDNTTEFGLSTTMAFNEFTFLPSLTISSKGLGVGFKIKVA
ncbi:MAG: hypothetical protein PHD88_06030 [Firmicutes bacterium]|nr:hypothetical protein [Bacillota bacterium]MDD4263715.1 hypothetical protein [Bacillota bacterium]MDD4693939.1 hypothetical protein [Bacillota bacterium]